jgi:hypothetical protein
MRNWGQPVAKPSSTVSWATLSPSQRLVALTSKTAAQSLCFSTEPAHVTWLYLSSAIRHVKPYVGHVTAVTSSPHQMGGIWPEPLHLFYKNKIILCFMFLWSGVKLVHVHVLKTSVESVNTNVAWYRPTVPDPVGHVATGRGKPINSRRCQFIQYRFHMHWPGNESRPPRWTVQAALECTDGQPRITNADSIQHKDTAYTGPTDQTTDQEAQFVRPCSTSLCLQIYSPPPQRGVITFNKNLTCPPISLATSIKPTCSATLSIH